jgi:glucose-1-phosphate cytidylyltransferase
MKVVILAGGKGTRLAEETGTTPKVMVEIGGRPLLWHIMRHYAHHGFREIYVALGYKGEVIRQCFFNLFAAGPRLSLDFGNAVATTEPPSPPDPAMSGMHVHLVDTGVDTATGGRLQRLRAWLGNEPFMVTYGDGVSNIDLVALRDFHRAHGRTATLSAVQPPPRFGRLVFDGDLVTRFAEKPSWRPPEASAPSTDAPPPAGWEEWINGGFFVFEPAIFDLLSGDQTSLEADVLPRLSATGQLAAYRHRGYWQCMDTVHEKRLLQERWSAGSAPWKLWTD